VKEMTKPALLVDTLQDDLASISSIEEINPITGRPDQFWEKVVKFDGYALGGNVSLKKIAEAIVQTEIPVNVNLLAIGIADSPTIGSQLAIIGLNNELIEGSGQTIAGRFTFEVAVSQMLIEGADTAFFLLNKEELPVVISIPPIPPTKPAALPGLPQPTPTSAPIAPIATFTPAPTATPILSIPTPPSFPAPTPAPIIPVATFTPVPTLTPVLIVPTPPLFPRFP
jgi:hypothetical protein